MQSIFVSMARVGVRLSGLDSVVLFSLNEHVWVCWVGKSIPEHLMRMDTRLTYPSNILGIIEESRSVNDIHVEWITDPLLFFLRLLPPRTFVFPGCQYSFST
jgi:hypothetical protein